ncbi:hypothetical protein GCM10007320_61400 [Pseudorhodoferax aquiterrae]|uniref:Uncharacterized protein n=1 Tax=Pseudorhodoferax aquiterrae TaxID=747304 RepID=A0ABQ3GDK0_9BURK|nr:hypothetical protein [Pseudorhodoferax aquiterrae]GHD02290.1 hypothetical protein GCM10007320_61400 [Pseudorhodoferax aquiterrae]
MDPSDLSTVRPLTLAAWMVIRQAHDLPILEAVRKMLDDIDAGHVAAVERQFGGLSLH